MIRASMSIKPAIHAVSAALATALVMVGAVSVRADDVQMRIGQIFAPDVPIVRCGAIPLAEDEHLKELGFDISVIHSAQLGGENEMAQQVATGELEMAGATASILAAWLEDLSVFETYYLYENVDQVYEAHTTPTAKALFDELRETTGMRVVGLPWLYGERHVFGNRPLRKPEDFEGLRMRVPETSVSLEGARSLGANPTPTAYAELYLALQQGIVDAAEAPASVAQAESFYEPADYFNKTGHLITAQPQIVNERFWQSLSGEQQQALNQAVIDAAERVRECVESADAEAYAQWRESGDIEIVDDLDIEAIRAKAQAYFSEGFPWSEAYRNLLSDLAEK